jgi:protein-disulfide isomerase
MRLTAIAAAALGLLVAAAAPAFAEASKSPALSPAQEEAVRKLVRDYLVKNPEVLVEAMKALREKQRTAARERLAKAIAENAKEIYKDPHSPVGGNVKGDVTIVEFFDYQCGYCKAVFERLTKTVNEDGKIRFVYKEFPILGPASVVAAKAALAARAQGKYVAFHNALMRFRGRLSQDAVFAIAKSVGLDADRLAKDMAKPEIKNMIDKNMQLARALKINGTPAFVIGKQLVPGALNESMLKAYIERARGKS